MTTLVTGATGFLGRRLVAELAPRHSLRVLVRPRGPRGAAGHGGGVLPGGFPAGVEVVAGDVADAASVRRAVEGCEAVVHAAALVKILAPAAEFDRINVGGLENVLVAAAAATGGGIGTTGASGIKVVYVSTFMALGPSERGPGGVLDESAPADTGGAGAGGADGGAGAGGTDRGAGAGGVDGGECAGGTDRGAGAGGSGAGGPGGRVWINSYERTKTLADRLARRAIAAGQPVVVVYPGVIYGPGEMTEGNVVVRHVVDLLHRRLPALLGKPERRWCHVFVDDVARGVGLALERARPGTRYVLGGENTALGDFYDLVQELSGVPVPRRRLPDGVAQAFGAVQKGWARLRGTTPALTPDLVEVYRHDWAYSSARAVAELGYTYRPLREGLAATLAWLRETGQWQG
ncbi:MAG: NAD-dependent epimerase/dehydratase family protein [Acidobacteria bacterium]|nr:NAD-dependent epimerase/dehydratase family protein [Acidobacteriota bacterium]